MGSGASTAKKNPFDPEAEIAEAPKKVYKEPKRVDPRSPKVGNGLLVIVVGAGLAGLSCANYLAEHGFKVQIYEAKPQVGGRVSTAQVGGVPIDIGCHQLAHASKKNDLYKLAQKYKLPMSNHLSDPTNKMECYDVLHGKKLTQSEIKKNKRSYEIFLDVVEEYRQVMMGRNDISVDETLLKAAKIASLPKEKQRAMYFMWELMNEINGASISDAGVLNYDVRIPIEGRGSDNVMAFKEGMQSLVEKLEHECRSNGVTFFRSTPVYQIEYSVQIASIQTAKTRVKCDYIVSALPLGVLKAKSVLFRPPPPNWKAKCIENFDTSVENKVILRFERIFWPPDIPYLCFMNHRDRGDMYSPAVFLNNYIMTGQPILTAIFAGKVAQFEKETDGKILERCLKSLDIMYGHTVTKVVEHKISRWGSDKYCLGTHTYLPVGTSFREFELMCAPLGKRVHFAGEHTHAHFLGTAHGAYLSGIRAAQDICEYVVYGGIKGAVNPNIRPEAAVVDDDLIIGT